MNTLLYANKPWVYIVEFIGGNTPLTKRLYDGGINQHSRTLKLKTFIKKARDSFRGRFLVGIVNLRLRTRHELPEHEKAAK